MQSVAAYPAALTVAPNGNVIVTGRSSSVNYGAPNSYFYATVCYDNNGSGLWTNRVSYSLQPADCLPQGLAADQNGNVFITGYSSPSLNSPEIGTRSDFLTIGYSSAGLPIWTNTYDALGYGQDKVKGMGVALNGRVFLVGNSWNETNLDCLTLAYEPDGTGVWTNNYSSPALDSSYSDDQGKAIAVGRSGNIYISGQRTSPEDTSKRVFLTLAFSNNGMPLWTNLHGSPPNSSLTGDNLGVALVADERENVYVVGSFQTADYVTLAYSKNGVPLWTNRYDGPASQSDRVAAIAIDPAGNIVVTGRSNGGASGDDYATVKYSSTGVPLWTNRYNGPGNSTDAATGVAVNADGTVFVSGYSIGQGPSFLSEYATIAYAANGSPIWTNRYRGSSSVIDAKAIVSTDTAGNVYVAGCYSGGLPVSNDVVIKYSAAGVPAWTNRFFSGLYPSGQITAMAVDRSGMVYLTGYADRNTSTRWDILTTAYSPEGALLWSKFYDSPFSYHDEGRTICLDAEGYVYVAGDIRPGASESLGIQNYLIGLVKYATTPFIVHSPLGANLLTGSSITLTSSVSGTGPLSYQWLLNGTPISGATNSTYSIAAAQPSQQGNYSVLVTNSWGNATSAPAAINIFSNVDSTLALSFVNQSNALITLSGAPGLTYAILASTNFVDWVSLNTNTSPFSTVDTNAQSSDRRFYRGRWMP